MECPHLTSNGLLLRKDLHTLYDRGYITITDDFHIQASKRIIEDYGNDKEFYAVYGHERAIGPDNIKDRPSKEFIKWHNENVF